MSTGKNWDIFCAVVDNYGDIGVCWRLARQLVGEHGLRVRLWVDRPAAFRLLWPGIDPARPVQSASGVEVRAWTTPFPEVEPADVVVEAFACELPETYLAAMAARAPKPRWINLEYLSAEDWVGECHGLASPNPRLPLTKHFFFPGFRAGTGGLLAERGLPGRARAFQRDEAAQAEFWRSIGLAAPAAEEIRVSLFCYANPALPGLLAAWAQGEAPVTCLVPEGVAAGGIEAFFGATGLAAGRVLDRGRLRVQVLPFLEQDRYDRLLWACDCNFVRGEDSFVRAQWAARPFVWQIYPQEDGAHWHKLQAFLNLFRGDLPGDARDALEALWLAWNGGAGAGEAWPAFWRHRATLQQHGQRWSAGLMANGDLAANLAEFGRDGL